MHIIILDLEASIQRRKGMNREILEIGAIKLDENLKMVSKFQAYVRPTQYYNIKNLVINDKVVISKNKIKNERDISRKMHLFEKWVTFGDNKEYVIATWSNSDIQILIDNYCVTKFNLSWMKNYIDIQGCFDDFIGAKKQTSLVNACKIIDKEGISIFNHRALSDAQLTTMVLKYLINNGYKFIYEKNPFVGRTCKIRYNTVK